MRRPLFIFIPIVAILFAVVGTIHLQQSDANEKPSISSNQQSEGKKSQPPSDFSKPSDSPSQGFDKNKLPLDEAASLWLIVNKRRPLQPVQYVPEPLVVPQLSMRPGISSDEEQLRQEAATALIDMFKAAAADGITLNLQSGYRSYGFQQALYNRYVRQQGQEVADTQSARPGHSEHQTGLAADVGGVTRPECNVEACFADTAEGRWVSAHAHDYGFIIRYPSGKQPITGYIYEPWHLRYVGPELAVEMHRKKAGTLEEFFGLPPAPDYH